jgi:hypothetical protein
MHRHAYVEHEAASGSGRVPGATFRPSARARGFRAPHQADAQNACDVAAASAAVGDTFRSVGG